MWFGTRPDKIFFHPLTCREHLYTIHVAEPAGGLGVREGSGTGNIFENQVVQKSGGQMPESGLRQVGQRI